MHFPVFTNNQTYLFDSNGQPNTGPGNGNRGSAGYNSQNGGAHLQFRPSSIHDYQPLTPFQETASDRLSANGGAGGIPMTMTAGGTSHLQNIAATLNGGGGIGGAAINSIGGGKSVYDEDDDEEDENSYCINWKCITTLCCLFALLFIALLFLIALKLFYLDPNALSQIANEQNKRILPLNDYIDKALEISVAPKSSRLLSVYALGPSLLTLKIRTSSSRVIIYGLEGGEPYATNFTFVHALSSSSSSSGIRNRAKRDKSEESGKTIYTSSVTSGDVKTVYQYLSNGKWYIRVFNDVNSYEIVNILTKLQNNRRAQCPSDCNNPNGKCNSLGYCVCSRQFTGALCEKNALDCGPHGRLVTERILGVGHTFTQACTCDPGWTGSMCDQSETGCYPPDCSGNGQCDFGTCNCNAGFTGDFCNETLCGDQKCNENGICIEGKCQCSIGYYGEYCESEENPSCSSTCLNGDCESGKCRCHKGFRGANCGQQVCENNCNNHGQCLSETTAEWYCKCDNQFTGPNCEIKKEPTCEDVCKTNAACCKADLTCLPQDRLPKECRIAPAIDTVRSLSSYNHRTPFLEKVSFLYRQQTQQRNVPFDLNDMKYIFVIRGQLLDNDVNQRAYLGASVSIEDHEDTLGYSTTQFNGWFDFVVATNSTTVALLIKFTGSQSGLSQLKRVKIASKQNYFVTLLDPIILNSNDDQNARSVRSYFYNNNGTYSVFVDGKTWPLPNQSPLSPGVDESDISGASSQPDSVIVEDYCSTNRLPKYTSSLPHFTQYANMHNKYDYGAVTTQNFATESYTAGEKLPRMVFNNNAQGYRRITLFVGDFSDSGNSRSEEGDSSNVDTVHVTLTVAGLVFQETFDNSRSVLYWDVYWNKMDVYGNKVYGLVDVEANVRYSIKNCSSTRHSTSTNGAAKIGAASLWVNSIKSTVEAFSCHDPITYTHHYCVTQNHPSPSVYIGNSNAFHFALYPPVMRSMKCLNPPKVIQALPNGDILIGDVSQIYHVEAHKIGKRCDLNYVYSFDTTAANNYENEPGDIEKSRRRKTSMYSKDMEYFIAVDPSSSEYFYLSTSYSKVITQVFIKGRLTPQIVVGAVGDDYEDVDDDDDNKDCIDDTDDADSGGKECALKSRSDKLSSPKGMTVLPNGTLVFVDGLSLKSWTPPPPGANNINQQVITLWKPSLRFTTSPHQTCIDIPSDEVFFSQLKDVKYNELDDTFVLFDYSRSVVKLNLRTNRVTYLASRPNFSCKEMNQQSIARVYYPCSFTINNNGDVFVADANPLAKQTVIFKVSSNNMWSQYWHSKHQMHILSSMTVTNNGTLLIVNEQEKHVDILGPYEILNNDKSRKIVDIENNRVVYFNDRWLHDKSESIATTDFTTETFSYHQDSTSLKRFMQSAGSDEIRIFIASSQSDQWEVRDFTKSGLSEDEVMVNYDYGSWQNDVTKRTGSGSTQNEGWIEYDSNRMITRFKSQTIQRQVAFVKKQLVEIFTNKKQHGNGGQGVTAFGMSESSQAQLSSRCYITQHQSSHKVVCSSPNVESRYDGLSPRTGYYYSYSSYPDGKQSIVLHDQTPFYFRNALPGFSSIFELQTPSDYYSIDYAVKDPELYGLQLKQNDQFLLAKLFTIDKSLVSFATVKNPRVQFEMNKETGLPHRLSFKTGQSGFVHDFKFNSARQLNSISASSSKSAMDSPLFQAKLNSKSYIITDQLFKVTPQNNDIEVSLMGMAPVSRGGQRPLYNISYSSDNIFELSVRRDNEYQKHSISSSCDEMRQPTSAVFNLFNGRYSYKTTFNESTLTLQTYDGLKRSASFEFDASYRLSKIEMGEAEAESISINYSPLPMLREPISFTKTVSLFSSSSSSSSQITTIKYYNDMRVCNYTINGHISGSKWIQSSFQKATNTLRITLRQRWGANVDLISNYKPFQLKSSASYLVQDDNNDGFGKLKPQNDALTFSNGEGLDITLVTDKLQYGFNDQYGPNKFQQTTFKLIEKELLRITTKERDDDDTIDFEVNIEGYPKTIKSYSIGVGNIDYCGKMIKDMIQRKLFKYSECRASFLATEINDKLDQIVMIKRYSNDGTLKLIFTKEGDKEEDLKLNFNSNGFISQLNDRQFSYNSLGQLSSARLGEFKIDFVYNIKGHLIARHLTSTNGVTREDHAFFYHDHRNPDKISHVLIDNNDDPSSIPVLYEIYYDYKQRPVMVKAKAATTNSASGGGSGSNNMNSGFTDETYLLVNDPTGTVLEFILIDQDSRTVKEKIPMPLAGSESGIKLSLSLNGSWFDDKLRLVYLNHRFFDLQTYTYLDLDLNFLLTAIVTPFDTRFANHLNDYSTFWPKHDLNQIGAFQTYMPELWFNSTIQNLISTLQFFKSSDQSLQLIPSISTFSTLFDNFISTPLNPNLPTISQIPFVNKNNYPRSPISPALKNKFVLPTFNTILKPELYQ